MRPDVETEPQTERSEDEILKRKMCKSSYQTEGLIFKRTFLNGITEEEKYDLQISQTLYGKTP